jgi:periplasmic protein TonB
MKDKKMIRKLPEKEKNINNIENPNEIFIFENKKKIINNNTMPDNNKHYLVYLNSFLLHAAAIILVIIFTGNFNLTNKSPKTPEFIDIVDFEEYIPPQEEKIQVVKKMKLEEDVMPDNSNFKEDENNVIRANPDGDENAKVLSQREGDDGEADYLPMNKIDEIPKMPSKEIISRIVYPPLALKQGIEDIVYLELYIDNTGLVRKIIVLKDPGFGFGDAAIKALTGIQCQPAKANGIPVATRYRYPLRFTIK